MTYTAGELAKKLGVSARTVRFYDEKNLLTPRGYSDAGYRLYDDESAERLQKILMLRFMDFSIEQIAEMMQEEGFDVRKSLKEQEHLLLEKKEHIERILAAVRQTQAILDENASARQTQTVSDENASIRQSQAVPDENASARQSRTVSDENARDSAGVSQEILWESLRRIIEITKEREYVAAQYRRDDNLAKRISIHDYSTAAVGWFPWMFEKIAFTPGMKVLDIGCGNAAFWKNITEHLPENLEIHLVDYSDGMLASAEKNVQEIQKKFPEKHLHFVLDKRDAADFSYPVSGFDRIMANHMLYHLNREARLALYPKINALLNDDGRFSCTLIGKTHFFELHELLRMYYPEIEIPSASFDIWLENAAQELCRYFTITESEEQKNDLLVPDEELVFSYVSSYSAQAKETISRDKELFLSRVRSEMNEEGYFYIHKSTGIVICSKLLK